MSEREPDKPQPSRRRVSLKMVLIGIIAFFLLLFAALNTNSVKVDFLAGSVRAPLFVAIAIVATVGFALGYLVALHRKGD